MLQAETHDSSKAGPPEVLVFVVGLATVFVAVPGSQPPKSLPHLGGTGRQMAVDVFLSPWWPKNLEASEQAKKLAVFCLRIANCCRCPMTLFLQFQLFLQILATTRARIDGEIHKIVGQVHYSPFVFFGNFFKIIDNLFRERIIHSLN